MTTASRAADLAGIRARTRTVYESQAEVWDRHRARTLFERPGIDRLIARIPAGSRILDLGCGAGEPIARYLIEAGHEVTGADFSGPMLAMARRRFPDVRWIEADMRSFDLGERFEGIIAWDSFFHLSKDEQRAVIPRLARHLAPGGALLVTVGPSETEAIGRVGSEAVYHASLSPEEYESRFREAGLRVADFRPEDPECDFHSVLVAVAD